MNNVLKQIQCTFAVFSALFITVVTSKLRGHQNCGPDELVRCAEPLKVLTDSGLTFASSKSDLDRMCPDLREAIRCIHGYTRHCMSQAEEHHFRKLFHGTGAMVHELCRNESFQEEYLKHTPCMKKVERENEICMKTYTTQMREIESRTAAEETTTSPPPDLITYEKYQKRKREAADEGIKSVCCAFQEYVECSTHTMRRACGEEAAEFSRKFLDKMSSSLISMHCQEYGRRECGLISAAQNHIKSSSVFLVLLSVLAYIL